MVRSDLLPEEEDPRRATEYGRIVRHRWIDLLIVLAAVAAALQIAFASDAEGAPDLPVGVAIVAAAAIELPLLARRRLPFAAPAGVWLLAAALSFADGRLVPFTVSASVVGLAASFQLGILRSARQSRAGLAIVLGAAAVVEYNDPTHTPGNLVFVPVLFGIAWVAGYALRERSEQAEAAEVRAALAAAEERARIGRELHDIVAHAVSVMVLQVGAIRHRLPESAERDALQGVEETGRMALAEMRRLLGAMRRGEEDLELAPQPGLNRLEALVEEVDRAGLPVRLRVDGEPVPLPHALDLSAYRIVQEGLTNALKHAHARQADVLVSYAPGELCIEVRDDGAGDRRNGDAGHGLIGVGERVKVYGGEMTAGGADGGGFVLRTRLPLGGKR
jgi:signal transduction histidine kinase